MLEQLAALALVLELLGLLVQAGQLAHQLLVVLLVHLDPVVLHLDLVLGLVLGPLYWFLLYFVDNTHTVNPNALKCKCFFYIMPWPP